MGRVIRLNEQEFGSLINNILNMALKGDGQVKSDETKTDSTTSNTQQSISSSDSKVVGSQWRSCNAWKSSGGLNKWKDRIKVEKGPSQFKISYSGPSSGLSIAHAANGKDTIHQLYNVLICELNPFLAEGKMKPKIDSITTQSGKNSDGTSNLSITVPIEKSDETYQIDRRGGWGHDPGDTQMKNKCSEIVSKGGKCFGPVRNVVDSRIGKITEYFITHTI